MAMYSIYVFVIYYVSLIYFLILCIPDKARVVFTPTVQYIPRGLKGIIKCQTSANPPIKYITWTKDNRLFQPFKTAGIEALLNGSLLIDQVNILFLAFRPIFKAKIRPKNVKSKFCPNSARNPCKSWSSYIIFSGGPIVTSLIFPKKF